MNDLYELREKLCDELKEYGKKELSAGSLSTIDSLAHAIKNIDKIIAESEGYSREYNHHVMRGRDSMGRYTRNGYSYHGDLVDELRGLMEDATNDQIKHKIKRLISEIESM